jgi:hypothetical protein
LAPQYRSKFKEKRGYMANFQLGDTEKVQYSLTELDADSNPASAQPGDVVTVVSADPASLTVVPDATPVAGSVASGFLVGGAKLATGLAVTATVTHADGTTLSVVDLIDIVGGKASSLSLGLGAPVAQ